MSDQRGEARPTRLKAPRRTTLSKRVMLWPTHVWPSIRGLRRSQTALRGIPERTMSVVMPLREVV